ncbi:hypothetical protein MYAER_0025 [Microcystis aeruginosa NIES-2549]|uniref:Uncharacterized protein n=1 Tax=Microcystis aeruginosa NIES-2549 TaxID=1641812 RepID=A0A0F6U0E6_MICAE|nr:hypothetical protein MYAER_0025 [Microcystis aeruginosa NIES-2549]AOC50780.1 hypothetical protein amyaer_0025 [Microcystis aeruginosa NIES-2481]
MELSTFCRTSTKLLFLKGKSPLKLGFIADFITQYPPGRILLVNITIIY